MHIFTSFLTTLALCFGVLAPACAQGMAKVRSLNNATATESEGWRHLGTGTMIDGWVTPGLTPNAGEEFNPMNYVFDVEVYESTDKPGTYKLASPYTSDKFPFVTKNENTTPHDIVIDATNPNFVRVEPQESGFVNTDKSRANYSDPFYIGNAGCYFNEEEGYDEAEIISYGYNSTLKDGVINIVSPRFGKAPKGAAFGYNWQGEYATVVTLPKEQPAEADGWRHLGTGTMIDGWVTPGLTPNAGEELNPMNYVFDVEVYESTDKPGTYKLASPYTSDKFPFVTKNENTTPHDIVIDATNPNFVRVEPQESGFVNTDKSRANYSDPFYIGNAGCYFNEEEGYDEADIISYGYNSTLKDGVINIVSPRFGKAPKGAAFGYNWQGEYATVITLPKEQPSELWKAAGKASFTDGFLSPGFSANPDTYTWDVDIEESSVAPGVYRLVNPYGTDACPLAGKNTETSPAYIRIDASDPDVVVIEPQYAGFKAMHSDELITFYIGNDAGIYVADGVAKEQLKASASFATKLDKMKDGVITIGKPLFGKNTTTEFGYEWTTAGGDAMNYAARISLNGATAIKGVSDATDATAAEYFDLQGMRVDTPQRGQVYIMRKGHSVSKIIK